MLKLNLICGKTKYTYTSNGSYPFPDSWRLLSSANAFNSSILATCPARRRITECNAATGSSLLFKLYFNYYGGCIYIYKITKRSLNTYKDVP